jgi:uncharacterized membrane protein YfcA
LTFPMWGLLLLPVSGFLVGILASMTGVGGGILIVPLLTVLFGFVPQHAVGTSLACIVFTALASSYSYARQKRIFYRTGLLLAVTSVPGAYLGAYLTSLISAQLLGLIFGFFIILVAVRMFFERRKRLLETTGLVSEPPAPGLMIPRPQRSDAELMKSGWTLVLGVGLSFFGGLASGFLGIGGGVLAVPILTFVLGLPIHFATATSMFTMIFTSLSGVAKHALVHHVHLVQALLLALGTVFGAQVGADFSKKISPKTLRWIFGALLLLMGIQMILEFL